MSAAINCLESKIVPENNDLIAALTRSYERQPKLSRYFASPHSLEFWIWASTNGIFLDAELKSALAPFPPVDLMCVGSNDNCELRFALSGADYYSHMERVLNGIGRSWGDMPAVLDFGCGVGRVSRLFQRHAPDQEFVGCDLSIPAIGWLAGRMPFGKFHLGRSAPPLPLESDSLDAIFSISVFTHLREESQRGWLREFHRLLKPGGVLLQTVHGLHAMNLCNRYPQWRNALNVKDADFLSLQDGLEKKGFAWVPHSMFTTGTDDYGVSFQSEGYVFAEWTRGLELIGVWAGLIDGWQDLVALRKSEKSGHTPVLPEWPDPNLRPVDRVSLKPPNARFERGEAIALEAEASGGEDVHFKFYVSEVPGNWRPLGGWQKEGRLEYVPWLPGEYEFMVHAASGRGRHSDSQAAARLAIPIDSAG